MKSLDPSGGEGHLLVNAGGIVDTQPPLSPCLSPLSPLTPLTGASTQGPPSQTALQILEQHGRSPMHHSAAGSLTLTTNNLNNNNHSSNNTLNNCLNNSLTSHSVHLFHHHVSSGTYDTRHCLISFQRILQIVINGYLLRIWAQLAWQILWLTSA